MAVVEDLQSNSSTKQDDDKKREAARKKKEQEWWEGHVKSLVKHQRAFSKLANVVGYFLLGNQKPLFGKADSHYGK